LDNRDRYFNQLKEILRFFLIIFFFLHFERVGDTIVVYNNTILEKPTNEKELLAFFDLYNQKDSRNQFSPIHIHTSLVLTCLKTKRQVN
jgi:hypothetical protein